MADSAHSRISPPTVARGVLCCLLVAALAGVAALILAPAGVGRAWGAPGAELHWYATGLGSAATRRQLGGNLGLLAVPAALAVLLWPPLRRLWSLVAVGVAAGAVIELLQWLLPIGRVASPLDAALNAAGAVLGGLLARAWLRFRRA